MVDTDGAIRVIIAGGGTVGLETAVLLSDRGHEIVLVEENPDRGSELLDAYVASVIDGDATRPSVLRQAQPERADVLAALTDDEASNFAICMAGQRMGSPRTVMRVDGIEDDLHSEFVDGIVSPKLLGARQAANEITGAGVRTLESVAGDVEIVEITVDDGAPVAGKPLSEIRLPRGSLIIVDNEGNRIGGPDTVLEAGNRYLIAVESDVIDEVVNLMRG